MVRKELNLIFSIIIDGGSPLQSNDDCFDVSEFIKSTKEDGVYFIWTCGCGIPGCAGYLDGIRIQTNGDLTIWKDNDLDKSYVFETMKLRSLAHALEIDLQKWKEYVELHQAKLKIWY